VLDGSGVDAARSGVQAAGRGMGRFGHAARARWPRHSPEAPAELERIVSKALRKDREERYQTINDLLVDLKGLKQELEFEARSDLANRPMAGGGRRAIEPFPGPAARRAPGAPALGPLLLHPTLPPHHRPA